MKIPERLIDSFSIVCRVVCCGVSVKQKQNKLTFLFVCLHPHFLSLTVVGAELLMVLSVSVWLWWQLAELSGRI